MALFKSRKNTRKFLITVLIVAIYVLASILLVVFTFLVALLAAFIDPSRSISDKIVWLDAVFTMNLIFLVPCVIVLVLPVSFVMLKSRDPNAALMENRERLAAALKSPDSDVRLAAIKDIEDKKFRLAAQNLTEVLLKDPVPEIRLAAYDTLKELDISALPILLNQLSQETNSDVKLGLLSLLRQIHDEGQIYTLGQVYKKEGDKAVKLYILESLNYFYSENIHELLVWIGNNERYADVKVKAIEYVVKYKDPTTEDMLKHLLFDPEPGVRDAAKEALKNFDKISQDTGSLVMEIVKAPCSYCGSLVDITMTKCPICGAPYKP